MKQVIAIVKPYLVEKVLDALKHAPLEACGVREVKGYGRQKSYLDEYHGSEYSLAYLPKVEITLWVDDLAGGRGGADDRRSRPHRPHGRRQDLRHARHARRRVGRRRGSWTVGWAWHQVPIGLPIIFRRQGKGILPRV